MSNPPNATWKLPTTRQELLDLVASIIRPPGSADPGTERAAIYGRVSRIPPHMLSLSMEVQPELAEEFARSKGWTIVDYYLDPDKSGRHSRRPQLQRMLRDVQAGRITVIVIPRLDRLYRNLESMLKMKKLLERYRVRLVSVTEQFDTDSPGGRVMLYLLCGMAEMFVRYTSEQTRMVKVHTAEKGLQNGSLPLGYCNGLCLNCTDPNGPGYCLRVGQLNLGQGNGRVPVPHPIDQYAVRLMAHLYQQAYSDRDIASHLNRHDFTLPDGATVHFRTRGIPGREPPGTFNPSGVRQLLQNPFHVGLIAEHERPPLEMDDDPEHPERRAARQPRRRNEFKDLHVGQHAPLYAAALWQANAATRKNKRRTPTSVARPRQAYLLTGVGFCWECYQAGLRAGLRGARDKAGQACYRCAVVDDNYKRRLKRRDDLMDEVEVHGPSFLVELLARHKVWLEGEKLRRQVERLLARFVIPPAWYERIQAYYVTDLGLSEFERQGRNLRGTLARARELFELGQIDRARFEPQAQAIDRELARLQPSAHPEAAQIAPHLGDFAGLWPQLTPEEQRGLLRVMFSELYVDRDAQIRRVVARAPFDKLLGLPEDGLVPPGMLD